MSNKLLARSAHRKHRLLSKIHSFVCQPQTYHEHLVQDFKH